MHSFQFFSSLEIRQKLKLFFCHDYRIPQECFSFVIDFHFFHRMYKKMNEEEEIQITQELDTLKQKLENKGYSSVEDFQLLRKIGEGTYSTVYKVRRLADDQIYALKKIKLDNMGKKDQEYSLNEVRLLASISHENIISYRQTFYEKGCLFLVLQFADNGDLLHEINQKKKEKVHFSQVQIWQVLLQIALALHTLHSQNIIHRDIKPANIFLNKQGTAKLGDLNVSKIVNNFCETQAGTPYYASPEIWKDQPYDKKSDIWSLGCSLYEMANLYPPFLGEDLQSIFKQITESLYPPLPLFYSKQLHKIIGKMLQKQPKKRYSAQFILRNIEKIIPEAFKNMSIFQKVKALFGKNDHKHTISLELLKTITFPNRKDRRGNQLEVNSYLPSPSYSRDHSVEELHDLTSSIASATINFGMRNENSKEKKLKLQKGVSLYASRDKQNALSIFKKIKEPIGRNKDSKLPQIKKKAAKK